MRLMMNSSRARPTPLFGMRGEVERAVGIADVHHDLDRQRRQRVEFDLRLAELELAVVDVARVAFGAGDGDGLAFLDLLRRVAAADDRGDAEFARDDRGMAGAAAAVGDDRRGALHHRLPVRVGHVGDQHVAGLDARHLADVADDARRAGADALADAAAGREHLAFLLQRVALDRAAGAALHRLRPRLQDVDLAGLAVLAPFDVHRAAVVLLDDQRLAATSSMRSASLMQKRMRSASGDVDGQHALARPAPPARRSS